MVCTLIFREFNSILIFSNCSSKRGRKSQRNTTNQQNSENQKNSTNSGESKGLAGGNITINNIKKKNSANNCSANSNNSQNSVKTQLTFDDLLEDTSGKKEASKSVGNSSSSKSKFSNNSTGLAPTSKRGHHLNR